jgi:hypothetical protein
MKIPPRTPTTIMRSIEHLGGFFSRSISPSSCSFSDLGGRLSFCESAIIVWWSLSISVGTHNADWRVDKVTSKKKRETSRKTNWQRKRRGFSALDYYRLFAREQESILNSSIKLAFIQKI